MKYTQEVYMSLYEKFDTDGIMSPLLKSVITNTGIVTIDDGYLEVDNLAAKDGAMVYCTEPLGLGADEYKVKFDFKVINASESLTPIVSVFCDQRYPTCCGLTEGDNYLKFMVAVDTNYKLYVLAYCSDDPTAVYYWDDNDFDAAGYTSTSITLTHDYWFSCIIQKKADRYRIRVEEADGTEILDIDRLTFTNFNAGNKDLQFSSGDAITGETGDYIVLGCWENDSYRGKTQFDNFFVSEPIDRITDYCLPAKVSLASNDTLDQCLIELNNISTKFNDVDMDFEIDVYMGEEEDV